jgi:hypothetical protein
MMPEHVSRQIRRPALRVVVPVILFCTYYPYAWLILSRGTWSSARWTWIKMWPALPGLLSRVMFYHYLPDGLALAGMYFFTVVVVALMIYLASLRTWLFGAVAVLVFLLSALNSLLAYALYRA